MNTKRIRAVVHGHVQGVFFRAYTQKEGLRLGLTGWTRNKPEGTVEVLMEGEDSAIDQMIQWLHVGSPMSLVTSVTISEEIPTGETGEFRIKY
ncbi:MAG: acylphosphatase [Proteobacteria bacterium]|nr:acylphosphatase [Pseudomonadota bacterium]MBU1709396.1 acylphosphatase [Pseudomonadota bacterium]